MTTQKRKSTILAICILSCFECPAQIPADSTKEILESLREDRDKKVSRLSDPLIALKEKYNQVLIKKKDECQQAGDLNSLLNYKEEITALKENFEFPPTHESQNAEIKRLRQVVQQQKVITNFEWQKAVQAIEKKYADDLKTRVEEMTKNGKIDDALEMQKELHKANNLLDSLNKKIVTSQPPNAAMTSLHTSKTNRSVSAYKPGQEMIIEISRGINMSFCWCPNGEFLMGGNPSKTQVQVTISKGFWMAKTEVNQAQWKAVMGSNPSFFNGDDLPVENLSWDDLQKFIEKMNRFGGKIKSLKMTLPTEAQWEYACLAGEKGPHSGGNIDEVAWYANNSASKTHPVGTKKPNAWGLHDMHGNVFEWCADYLGEARRGGGLRAGIDPMGSSSNLSVVRGGNYLASADECSAACRAFSLAKSQRNAGPVVRQFGFRVALVP